MKAGPKHHLRAVPKPAPIGGLMDPRFVYVPHREHTLEGFRARMEQYRTEQLKGKK